MPFTLPAPTSQATTDAKVPPVWANFLAIANALNGLAPTPTGTGFIHVTGGVQDAAAVSLVKSMQYGTVTIAAGATSGTATITAVNVANALLVYLGYVDTQTTYANPSKEAARITLTNSTTITASVSGTVAAANSIIVGFVVCEFN